MELVNLTPHTLNIQAINGEIISIPPSGKVARIKEETKESDPIEGISTHWVTLCSMQDLPTPKEGVCYITSKLVAQAENRYDVFSPGPLVRDEQGRPTHCIGLQRYDLPPKVSRDDSLLEITINLPPDLPPEPEIFFSRPVKSEDFSGSVKETGGQNSPVVYLTTNTGRVLSFQEDGIIMCSSLKGGCNGY